MKKRILSGIVGVFLMLMAALPSKAQQDAHNNTSAQPVWGPVGYQQADYYYLPDMECYYSVATRQFIYMDGGRWVFNNNLPPSYPHYDLFTGYKVVVNRPRPFLNFEQDRTQYARYRGYRGHQVIIRDSLKAAGKSDNEH